MKDHHKVFVFTYCVERTQVVKGEKLVRGERRPITPGGLQSEWRRMRARAEVEDFRFHDYRANCGIRSTRDFWTRSICLRNGTIRNTRFTDCLARSAILNLLAVGQNRKRTNYGPAQPAWA